ncbi:MAG: NUDIX hydrolase [Anaerolineales bacterium]|nr:NUDIX hydrolase [Anaerolineales bacterium]MCB9128175.1 NUDIX hydrolase [Ardenticatenales bacterium]MCB9171884.1 NUDIX hydrolase [Ardenticatenales bacterium]
MIQRRGSRIVYQNRWMTVREDEVEFADGSRGIYGVVDKPHFALVMPLDGDHLYLVRQYRYPVGSWEWEFPQGSAPNDPRLDPAQLAAQELREETGLRAGRLAKLGFLYEAYGYANQGFHIFVASALQLGHTAHERGEAGMELHRLSLSDVKAMIRDGTLRDAPSVSAFALLMLSDHVEVDHA